MLRSSIDADCEGRLVRIGVAVHHQRKIQSIEAITLHCQTDQPSGFSGHEIDLFGCGELGCADQVPFVLPTLIVDDNNAFTVANGFERIRNGVKQGLSLR